MFRKGIILFLVSNLFYGEDDSNENQKFLRKGSRCRRQKSTEPERRAEIPLSQETQGTGGVDQAAIVRRNPGGRVHPGSFVQVFRLVFGQPGLGCPTHQAFQSGGLQSVPGFGRGQVDNPAEKWGLAGQPAAAGFDKAEREVVNM